MPCLKCGCEIAEGERYCSACAAAVPAPSASPPPSPRAKLRMHPIAAAILGLCVAAAAFFLFFWKDGRVVFPWAADAFSAVDGDGAPEVSLTPLASPDVDALTLPELPEEILHLGSRTKTELQSLTPLMQVVAAASAGLPDQQSHQQLIPQEAIVSCAAAALYTGAGPEQSVFLRQVDLECLISELTGRVGGFDELPVPYELAAWESGYVWRPGELPVTVHYMGEIQHFSANYTQILFSATRVQDDGIRLLGRFVMLVETNKDPCYSGFRIMEAWRVSGSGWGYALDALTQEDFAGAGHLTDGNPASYAVSHTEVMDGHRIGLQMTGTPLAIHGIEIIASNHYDRVVYESHSTPVNFWIVLTDEEGEIHGFERTLDPVAFGENVPAISIQTVKKIVAVDIFPLGFADGTRDRCAISEITLY